MALWANLHGGFVLGLMLIAPIALDAVLNADARVRKSLALRWAMFGVAALAASCCTPYGWHALLASQKILGTGRGAAADHGMAARGFLQRRRRSKFVCCAAFGMALWRGVMLPPMRIVLLLGLLHMALSHERSIETLRCSRR